MTRDDVSAKADKPFRSPRDFYRRGESANPILG